MDFQILLDKLYGRTVDWWYFGTVLYQMTASQSPFAGDDEDKIYDAVLNKEPSYPPSMPNDVVDIVKKLLVKKPEERLGYHKGAEEIMTHVFFKSIDWDALYKKEVTPPFRPNMTIGHDLDPSNFDKEFTSTEACWTPVESGVNYRFLSLLDLTTVKVLTSSLSAHSGHAEGI